MAGRYTPPPPSGTEITEADWTQFLYQLWGNVSGASDWGRLVDQTALTDDANYYHTIRNNGTGGALDVQLSDGSHGLRVNETGVEVSSLLVDGAFTVGGTLHVLGNTDLDGTLNVDGAATLASLHVTGASTLDGTLGAGASTLASLHVTGTSALDGTATLGASLAFSGTGGRITGDLSNATFASRLAFQSSTANGATIVEALPNGASNVAGFGAFSSSTPGSADVHLVAEALATEGALVCASPSGTFKPLTFYTSNAKQLTLDTSGNLILASGGLNLGTTGATTGGIKATNSISTTGGISAGASSSITGGLSVVTGGLSVLGGGLSAVGAVTFDNARLDASGNKILHDGSGALATTATAKFVFLPYMLGTPTGNPGTPTGSNGSVPLVIDLSANKLWFWTGAAWKQSAAFT